VPDASKFRVFGCAVFAKVPDKLRRKLGEKAFRGVMVGYGSPHPHFLGQHSSLAQRSAHNSRGGRRPTIDPVVIGRVAHEAIGFDKDTLNRSMKMSVPTMGPNSDFKLWERNFLNFLSL
jgi:hypothetical protein